VVTGGSLIGGGHIGCNYQWTPLLVIGVEGDYSGMSLNATGHAESLFARAAAPGGGITWSSRFDSIATVRGRIGFALTPNTLVYLTGGGAWGRASYSSTDVFFFGCPNCATTSFSNTASGLVLGGGLEWAPWSSNWIVRGEYLYYSLSGGTGAGFVAGIPIAAANPTWSNMAVSSGRLGLSYKF
jgi:outer membrane immunogenic protein